MWIKHNENPRGKAVGDCVVRAIAHASGQTWETTFKGLSICALSMCDMPSANAVWGAYLKTLGFRRRMIPDTYQDNYTVSDFCDDHPYGQFLLALDGHVLSVKDGDYYDTWDSGTETPLYYWERVR